MINILKGNIEAMETAKVGALTKQGWIVICGDSAMTFDVNQETGVVTNQKTTLAHRARRFSQENATHIAPKLKNGKGDIGRPIPYIRAIELELESTKRSLEYLQAKGGLENG